MAICDLCSAEMSLDEGTAYAMADMEGLAARGFDPPEQLLAKAIAAGLSREQVMARWRYGLTKRATWLLCPVCAARAAQYRPQPAPSRPVDRFGTSAAGRPAGAGVAGLVAPSRDVGAAAVPVPPLQSPQTAPAPPWLPPAGAATRHSGGLRPYLVLAIGFLVVVLLVLATPFLAGGSGRVGWGAPAPTASAPVSPRPTRVPTATPVPDLTGAMLRLEDLPAEFEPLTEAEKAEAGLSEQDLKPLWEDFSEARPLNVTAFWSRYPGKVQVIISLLVYPLTPLEQAAFDRDVADGTKLGSFPQPAGSSNFGPPGLLSDMGGYGDCSIGITATDNDPEFPVRLSLGLVRRGQVLEVLYVYHEDGKPPPVDIRWLTLRLDMRVAEGLGK